MSDGRLVDYVIGAGHPIVEYVELAMRVPFVCPSRTETTRMPLSTIDAHLLKVIRQYVGTVEPHVVNVDASLLCSRDEVNLVVSARPYLQFVVSFPSRPAESLPHRLVSEWFKAHAPAVVPPVSVVAPHEANVAMDKTFEIWRDEAGRKMGGRFAWHQVTKQDFIRMLSATLDAAGVPGKTQQAYLSAIDEQFQRSGRRRH